jgi:2-furoyl-CoA dehydrogenase large subunit
MFALLPLSFAVVPVAPPCCSVGGQWSTSSNRSFYLPGRFLHQVRGGFAMAIGAALYERFVYVDDGGFLTGSFADYAVPTASMIPELEILHMESPSPVTPLGAKGVAEGNAMSTPVCIANAVADALGVAEISVPLTPERMLELLRRGSSAPRHKVSRR